jgi:hypothetical protein
MNGTLRFWVMWTREKTILSSNYQTTHYCCRLLRYKSLYNKFLLYVTSHIHLRSDSMVKQPRLRESSVKHEARRAIPIHERTNMSVARYQIGSQSIFC